MVMEEQEGSSGLASESVPVPRIHHTQLEPNTASVSQVERKERRSKPRLRKKALHAQILKQMEFYFSDANLSKDRFLGKLIATDPYVDLDVFLRCNKIRILTQDKSRIAKALQASTMLTLSDDGEKVCRTTPINSRDNCDESTIYLQGLPPDADHEWLDNIFSQYGPVAYISMPRYKTNRKLKGFAFIEFETMISAEECLKAFQEKNCILPPYTDPNELLSITTFSEDVPPNELDSGNLAPKPMAQAINVLKRSTVPENRSESGTECTNAKKARLNGSEDEKTEGDDNVSSNNIKDMDTEVEDCENENSENDVEKKKKSRGRKRRGRLEQPGILDFGLHIMAKKDWKKLRNKYLQLQRTKMKQLKQHLRKTRWNQWNSYDRNDKTDMEDMNKNEGKEHASTPKYTFSQGLIVKIMLDEVCSNPKTLKNEYKAEAGVQYIDLKEGSSCAHIRFDTTETATNFVQKYSESKTMIILQGDEEKRYWNKMALDREEKLGKKDRVKQRGRDKLLKKAEKELGKHIKFDEV